MSCPECENIEEIENYNSPFVIRKCDSCGREMKILDPGDHGIGIRVNRGDRFVIPAEWLKISANPLQGTGHFTRTGLEWFAKLIFLGDFPRKKEQIDKTLKTNDEICVNLLNESEMLSGLNVEKLDDSEKVFSILSENKESAEWFAYTFGMFNQITQEAIQERDAQKAAWAMAGAERFRSMLVFKQELEEVIWMGHSAKRLIEILNIWRNNQTNSDEEFWQIQFNQHAYVISQVFSVPVVFIEEGSLWISRS